MSVLVIDSETEARVKEVKRYAMANRMTIAKMEAIMAGKGEAPGDNPNHVVHFKGSGFRLVITLDEMLENAGWVWHVSGSIPRPRLHPSPELMDQLMTLCDLDKDNILNIWLEPLPPVSGEATRSAINIVAKARNVDLSNN